jgi:NACHT domain
MKRTPRIKNTTDTVRFSRDGHEYHEAWTARRAMQLLWPASDLNAIAVEGLSPADQPHASTESVEIADLTLYYGQTPEFEHATRVTIAQFKYSEVHSSVAFRAADAKTTVAKFAVAYQDSKKKHGAKAVGEKLDFELVTNRPIYPPLLQAIEVLGKGLPCTGEVAKQAEQFKAASGLHGKLLANFAGKCRFVGLTGNLTYTKNELTVLMVDWSATSGDPRATARLGQLMQMVRNKAGSAGMKDNLIKRTDILVALQIGDPEDLLPCKPAIPDVGKIVEREQLAEALALISGLSAPLLIHASGGFGKTVFMTSLARAMDNQSEVVFFDCFGGGAYRSPEDSRHLPKRGLIHIANTLAFRGLCDPILPDSIDVQSLLSTFRRRLEQCVKTLNNATPGRGVVLFIDAIDNAALAADARSEDAFPILLLESIHHKPIAGVTLIVSCRPERRPSTDARYEELELRPFNLKETGAYLRTRLPRVSQVEIKVAQARSGGNPRVLEYLAKSGRGLLDESEADKKIKLDDLIQQRITDALATARERGYPREAIDAFLAGLAVLPPPVPLDEYAGAHGLEPSAVESFAADLRPLLERTNQGLMFRDEPTETLVHERYSSSPEALRRVADNLFARQDSSVYAARALPGLLHRLDAGEELFQLAFDNRMPAAITTTVGKRNVRYARIKAAVLHAAIKIDHNRLVQLLLELSSLAAIDLRGANYILDCPDLVVAAQDVDARRRLFETRTGWPGTRHARLAIANSLAGESEEASRHAVATQEWIDHYRRTTREDRRHEPHPERPDIAAVPFFLLCEDKPQHAARFLQGWRDWYAYEVCESVIQYFQLAVSIRPVSPQTFEKFVDALTGAGPLAAVLSFHEFPARTKKDIIAKLYRACKRDRKLHLSESFHRDRPHELQDGLRQAATFALTLGMTNEALGISLSAPSRRSSLWSLRDNVSLSNDVFPFVFRTALLSAARRQTLHEKDIVPAELVQVCARIGRQVTGKDFRDKVKDTLSKFSRKGPIKVEERPEPGTLSYDQRQQAERFLDYQLEPLLTLTQAFSNFLSTPRRLADRAFEEVLRIWREASEIRDPYRHHYFDSLFRFLGFEVALFTLRARTEITLSSVKSFLAIVYKQNTSARRVIEIIAILARRSTLHTLAGEQALQARKLIEAENDVTERASLYADLGRAMLPASIDEASVYFRYGLEQMDAIGSGDQEFTNELLLFAAAMKGSELGENELHTLTNICELNMGEEPEKFGWCAFAKGMSRVAGPRVLAKLSRWDDRSKIDLEHTLLPYLTALIADGKIDSEVALCLNRLARPVEYWHCGTQELAEILRSKGAMNKSEIIAELIKKYEDDYHSIFNDSIVETFASLAGDTLGSTSETTAYLAAALKRQADLRDAHNEHMNYRGVPDTQLIKRLDNEKSHARVGLQTIAAATDPANLISLTEAIKAATDLEGIFDFKGEFFAALRAKVPFGRRTEYIRHFCGLEIFNFYWKLTELKECRDSWVSSSAALGPVFKDQALVLIQLHADDLMSHGRLSGFKLNEIADLTGVPAVALVLELIKVFARPGISVPSAVWLALGSFVVEEADEGQGQIALTRLLRSDAARLTNKVVDGAWKSGLYPEDNVEEVAVGLVWRMLGAPYAEGRWRAAHSIRCFARFGRWNIVDALASRLLNEETAGPFQAGELSFYFMHARLWLLIAFARMALDYPKEITRYKDSLLQVVEERDPHVLMRHFAARALLACVDAGDLKLPTNTVTRLREVDLSPYPRLKQKTKKGDDFYQGRPSSAKKPKFEFDLDYDFHKNDVDSLSSVFGKPLWEVEDRMSEIVHKLAPNVSGMHETGGRPREREHHGLTTAYHTYGQQLGWHALFFAAGKLLKNSPVTNDSWYEEDPWRYWMSHYLLTRDDGLWLSDGMDRRPLDTDMILLEKGEKDLALTGDSEKLLRLVGFTSRIGKEIVVEGSWRSADNIRVHISSALVPHDEAERLARELVREEPMRVWLPIYEENEWEEESPRINDRENDYTPWMVRRSREARLDEHDPFGAPCANSRARVSRDYASALSLSTDDSFSRTWQDKRKRIAVRAQAWGRENKDSENGPYPGLRLLVSAPFLREVLKKFGKDLLLLISLERYERKSYQESSKFTHTVAVVRVTDSLNFEYFRGYINHAHES